MKFAKLSLATVIALSGSAYAVELENIKVSGQATLYYQTMSNSPQAPWYGLGGKSDKHISDDNGLFHKDQSKANVGLGIKFESDLGNDFGFGAKLNVLETLGLEHNLVSGTMQGVGSVSDGDSVTVRTSISETERHSMGQSKDEWFFGEAYLTKKIGKTLLKVGRQELNTPLVFTEKWNVLPTTFDAVVAINSDVENLTLIGAYVSKGNSHGSLGNFNTLAGGKAANGAYALAGLYAKDEIKANAWLYNVPAVIDAVWADVTYKADGITFVGQTAQLMFNEAISKADDTQAFAGKLAYKVSEDTTVCLAGSITTGKTSSHTVANFGTGLKTKLATATISGDGPVAGATDTAAYKIKVVQNIGEYGKLTAQFAQYMHGKDSSVGFKNTKGKRADVTATVFETIYTQKIGGVDILGAYMLDQNINGWTVRKSDSDDSETAHTVRVVLRYNF